MFLVRCAHVGIVVLVFPHCITFASFPANDSSLRSTMIMLSNMDHQAIILMYQGKTQALVVAHYWASNAL